MIRKAWARTFERLYHARNRKKTCALKLSPDTFDGDVFDVESFYERYSWVLNDPCAFYRDPPTLESLGFQEATHPREMETGPRDYRYMTFRSPLETQFAENNIVPLRWFTFDQPADTFLLFVPGWGRSSQSFETGMCRRWRAAGVDTAIITKPYHQARTPAASFTGEYFISANLFWTIANFQQLVAEIRAVLRYMRPRYKRIGLFGMSSGGFQAGLAANCEDIDYYFPFVTGCQLGSITWHGLITQYLRRDLEARGIDEAALNKVWSVTDLLYLGKFCRARNIKHYIAKYDSVVPTPYQVKLWEIYGKHARVDLESSHYSSYFHRNRIIDDTVAFIKTTS